MVTSFMVYRVHAGFVMGLGGIAVAIVTVDIVGLFLLFIQHLQIGRQIYLRGEKLKNYWLIGIFLIIVNISVFLLFIGAYHHLDRLLVITLLTGAILLTLV